MKEQNCYTNVTLSQHNTPSVFLTKYTWKTTNLQLILNILERNIDIL